MHPKMHMNDSTKKLKGNITTTSRELTSHYIIKGAHYMNNVVSHVTMA